MEADLQRWYQLDYRDRWHPDRRQRLTLRRLLVLVFRLPGESATMRALNDGKPVIDSLVQIFLADIWQASAQSKKPHPLIADARQASKSKRVTADRRVLLAAAKRRARERRMTMEGGVG